MKKHFLAAVLAAAIFLCSISALRVKAAEGIIVFAAASLTEPLEEIAELYKASNPEREIIFNFDSSGTLKRQIEEGADCDLFISASAKEMNELDATQNSKEEIREILDYIISDTRVDLLENKLVLIAAEDEPVIKSFKELADAIIKGDGDFLLAIGNSDVPAGRYVLKALESTGLNEETLLSSGMVTYGSSVKEVLTQVQEAAADYGVVYMTDAVSGNAKVIDAATEEMCGKIAYPAAVLKESSSESEAREFLEFLTGDKASEVFERIGFTVIRGEE